MPAYRTQRQEVVRRLKALAILLVICGVLWLYPGGKAASRPAELLLDEGRLDAEGGRAPVKDAVEQQLARSAMGSVATLGEEQFVLEVAPQRSWIPEAFSDVVAQGNAWKRAEETYAILDALMRGSYPTPAAAVRTRCAALSQQQQLADAECHAEWAHRLKTAAIMDVDMMLGFDKGKRNAFRVVFEDGSYGWFKACPGDGENPDMEISAYHLDHILGFHLISPAVKRELVVKELERAIRPENEEFKEILAQTDYLCSGGRVMRGVMLGWWDGVVPVRSPIAKKDSDMEEVLAFRTVWNKRVLGLPLTREERGLAPRDSEATTSVETSDVEEAVEDDYPYLQLPRVHAMMFMFLVLQHQGHNEFRIDNGPLVIIDVDRAIFTSTKPFKYYNLGLESLCKMDHETFDTFRHFMNAPTPGRDLGALLGKALMRYNPHVVVDSAVRSTINQRVDMIATMMDKCILLYGEQDVIYHVDWKALRDYRVETAVDDRNWMSAVSHSLTNPI